MTTATLGGLIKDHRIKKRLSQLEVSLRIGWQDTTRLSKIEQGRVGKPTRKTIEKVIKALALDEQEKGDFLFTGGYLPTEEEIVKIKQKTQSILDNWPYPAAVLDFSWRVINQNKANMEVYQTSSKMNEEIFKNHTRVIEILFNPNLKQHKLLKGQELVRWHTFLTLIIVQFNYEQRIRAKEKWYISHIKEMLKNDLFRKLWTESQTVPHPEIIVGKFATKTIAHPKNPHQVLNFYLFVIPILDDPRFEMEFLVPMDINTYQYYKSRLN